MTIALETVGSVEFSGKYCSFPCPVKITLTSGESRIVSLQEASLMTLKDALGGKVHYDNEWSKEKYEQMKANAQFLDCNYLSPRDAKAILSCIFNA